MNRIENLSKRIGETINGQTSADSGLRLFITVFGIGAVSAALWNNVDVQNPWFLKDAARIVEASPLELLAIYQLGKGLQRAEREELHEVMREEEERRQRIIQKGKLTWR